MKCNQVGCKNTATHSLVWNDKKFYCDTCVQKVLIAADVMGYSTPKLTVEKLPQDVSVESKTKILVDLTQSQINTIYRILLMVDDGELKRLDYVDLINVGDLLEGFIKLKTEE